MFDEQTQKEGVKKSDEKFDPGWWQKILANISIEIEDVYVRVEDSKNKEH